MHPCNGVFNNQLRPLVRNPGHYGSLKSEHILIASQIQAQRHQQVYPYKTQYELEVARPSEVTELESLLKNMPLYHSTTEALRSTVCIGFSLDPEKPCACCEALLHDNSLRIRMKRAYVTSSTSKFTRHDHIASHCMLQRMRALSGGNADLWFAASNAVKCSRAATLKADA